MIFLHHPAVSQ